MRSNSLMNSTLFGFSPGSPTQLLIQQNLEVVCYTLCTILKLYKNSKLYFHIIYILKSIRSRISQTSSSKTHLRLSKNDVSIAKSRYTLQTLKYRNNEAGEWIMHSLVWVIIFMIITQIFLKPFQKNSAFLFNIFPFQTQSYCISTSKGVESTEIVGNIYVYHSSSFR